MDRQNCSCWAPGAPKTHLLLGLLSNTLTPGAFLGFLGALEGRGRWVWALVEHVTSFGVGGRGVGGCAGSAWCGSGILGSFGTQESAVKQG